MKPILRKVDTGHNYSFSVREDIYPYLYNHWHYHPEVELTLIRKGSGMRLVGDSMERFDDGDLILLGADLPHMWRSDDIYFQELPGLQIEAVAVHFKSDFWGPGFLDLPEMKQIKNLLTKARHGIRINGQTCELITARMEAILKASPTQRISSLLHMLDMIANSNEYSLLSSIGFTNSYNIVSTDNINKIYTYTFNNFQQKITLKEVAAAANISPNSFCRYFKSRTLKTYWQFLLEVRIGYACKLLIENNMGVSQVGYTCGFNNLSNFNRQFKGLTNKTPLQYVKEYVTRSQLLAASG
ncbi:MAG TPA: AraC family transcriptional regulator [Chitinophaga sp.]|uniref:AraC family transcriptional regulator n=1 Tax=Chitinophaga sp. TaxID=1869181 RepID=UPI002B522811|nr:AraC family transcriptional regulator [Chitinophaga sp.]HVI45728.1 AraC family transcriptional regulator [Chitinophaga sp.]